MGQSFRIGLRVSDVPQAMTFVGGLGFEVEGVVPDPDDNPVLAILRRGEANLVLDALVGLPFPDTPRERQVQSGPRGLGVVFGLEIEDLDEAYAYCRAAGCVITCEPMDEAWGERLFSCLDPFGYEWELFQPIAGREQVDGTAAVRELVRGDAVRSHCAPAFGPAPFTQVLIPAVGSVLVVPPGNF